MKLEPLRELMSAQFYMDGEQWELEQQTEVAAALGSGNPSEAHRDYKITVDVRGTLESQLLRRIVFLFQAGDAM